MDPETGEMMPLEDGYTAVGALLPQGYPLVLPGYVKSDKEYKRRYLVTRRWYGRMAPSIRRRVYPMTPRSGIPVNCDLNDLELGVKTLKEKYPENRLYEHLSNCALGYECLTASNTFLNRWEGAVPVSYSCNAGRFGCISEQPDDSGFVAPQTRMNFRPRVDELVQVMLEHLKTPESIISFGQGCEESPPRRRRSL